MYTPKYCPECGESRPLDVETKPNFINCRNCGMGFKVKVSFGVDSTPTIKKGCENCGTREKHGCSSYTAEDCGPHFKLWVHSTRWLDL